MPAPLFELLTIEQMLLRQIAVDLGFEEVSLESTPIPGEREPLMRMTARGCKACGASEMCERKAASMTDPNPLSTAIALAIDIEERHKCLDLFAAEGA